MLPFVFEVMVWAVPAGPEDRAPGFGFWALSLLLVGVNEKLISKVVALERMRAAFPPALAVVVTAVLFGLQLLSTLVTTSRALEDVLLNVVVSAAYGAAAAAFQARFRRV